MAEKLGLETHGTALDPALSVAMKLASFVAMKNVRAYSNEERASRQILCPLASTVFAR